MSRITETAHREPRRPALWVAVIALVAAALLLVGAILAMVNPTVLGDSHDPVTATVRVYADYVVARDGVLAIMLVLLLVVRAGHTLAVGLLVVGLVQAADAVLDAFQGRLTIVPVAAVIAIACIASAVRQADAPLWRRSSWIGR